MQLLSRGKHQKLVLAYLYELRNTPMAPPDARLSILSIADTLGLKIDETARVLAQLEAKGYVYPFKIGRARFCKLTCFGAGEVRRTYEHWSEVEVSSSRLGFVKGKKTNSSPIE